MLMFSLLGLTLFCLGAEMLLLRLQNKPWDYDWAESRNSTYIFLIQVADNFVFRPVAIGLTLLAYNYRLVTLPDLSWYWLPVGIALYELAYYWLHRYTHRARWGWINHRPHHTAKKFNITMAYRVGPGTFIAGLWVFSMPLVLLGFKPEWLLICIMANKLYTFFVHTEVNIRLGPLEYLFVIPSHHRVHHGCNKEYIDKNYGGILIIYDRIFGTFQEEDSKVKLVYGTTENIDSHSIWQNSFKGWVDLAVDVYRTPGFKNKLRLFYKPPGWQPVESKIPAPAPAEEKRRTS